MLAVLNLTFLNHYWFRQPPTGQWQASLKQNMPREGAARPSQPPTWLQGWLPSQKFPGRDLGVRIWHHTGYIGSSTVLKATSIFPDTTLSYFPIRVDVNFDRRYREVCCVWKKMRNVQLLSKWGQKPAHLQPKVQNDFRIFWPEVSIKSILGTIYHLRLYQCPVGRKWREPFQGTNHSQTGKNQLTAPT